MITPNGLIVKEYTKLFILSTVRLSAPYGHDGDQSPGVWGVVVATYFIRSVIFIAPWQNLLVFMTSVDISSWILEA